MKKNFQESFKQDLAKIMRKYNNSVPDLGTSLGREIAKKIEDICEELDQIKNNTDFVDKINDKFKISNNQPKIYRENGHSNCEGLFFEYKFSPLGFFVVIGFCFPFMFKTTVQRQELSSFTPKANQKYSDKECVEFFFAVASAKGSIEFD